MRTLSSAILIISVVLQPLSAFAFYETPGQIMQAVQFDPSANMISAEIHGVNGTTFVSAWIKGQKEGMEYADTKLNVQVTVDVEDTAEHVKGRLKGSVILLNGLLYIKVDSLDGTFEDEVLLGTLHFAMKKWIQVPVDAETMEEIHDALHHMGDPLQADDRFTMTRVPYQYGSSYTLSLQPGSVEGMTRMDIKVDTDYKDAVQVSQMTAEGVVDDFTIHGKVKTERMKHAMSVSAPADAVSFDWLFEHFSSLSFNDTPAFDASSFDALDVNDDIEQEVPSSSSSRRRTRPSIVVTPVDRVDSAIVRPSRRLLKMGNTNRR